MARSRKPTSHDVARRAGVSRTTVSLVLNDVPDSHISPETRRRVLQAARELDYYPDATARRLVSGRTRTIALVWHRGPDRDYRDGFLPGFLQGIAAAARHYGNHVLFRPLEPGEPPDAYVELARGGHADGLILSGPRSDDTDLLKLHEEGYALVLHGQLPGTGIPSVDVDNVHGAMTAVGHLLSLGHRAVACITNAPLAYIASAQRLEGYRQALAGAGITYDEGLVDYGNFDEESGRAAMARLLARPQRPTALFVASDVVAIGALRALREAGLSVPQDLAMASFDDIPAARYITPTLTTVHVPTFGLGWSAAELLLHVIAQEEPRQGEVRLDTDLVVRESCGAQERG